jgi:hypothetical protein
MWTLDHGQWCECSACRAVGSPTDRNLLLVHQLDQAIKRARQAGRIHRPVSVAFLAYADVVSPPTRPLPPGFDYETCVGTFFPVYRSYAHNIDDPHSNKNRQYVAQIRGWLMAPNRHYQGQLCIGEYYNISRFRCLPICHMHTMANDIPCYHRLGARDFHYMHCLTRELGSTTLTNYQMARQLWDVETDCDVLWRDYFSKRYGDAADTMRRFYETLEPMFTYARALKYDLAARLNRGDHVLFPKSELRYERQPGVPCTGTTLKEIVTYGKECRRLIDQAMTADLPAPIPARIAEDERRFTYGERTVLYYDACASGFLAARAGRAEEARRHLQTARRLAGLLREDTRSTRVSSSHASASDAFAATFATGALDRLQRLVNDQSIHSLHPDSQTVVIPGREMAGGGGRKYGAAQGGFEIHLDRTNRRLSQQGNHLYAEPTGSYGELVAELDIKQLPEKPLRLTLVGLSRPVNDADEIPMQVSLGDHTIYEGPAPFALDGLERFEVVVPVKLLQPGRSRIAVRNLAPTGRIGHRPWIGLDRIELRVDSQ